ncbi:hypothetical protein WME94_26790 [Sorangium sp. So ce429]
MADVAIMNHVMNANIRRPREVNPDVPEEGATIETTNGSGEGMAPCPMCAQIFRELGIHPANIGSGARGGVIGPNDRTDTNVKKMGRWDGSIVQPSESVRSRSGASATQRSSTPPFSGR